ncbi:MAG: FHA domain-containing protein [Roseovarius sp.]|nr:FHA domain-containing protein [Roseovarius sp.]
MRFIRDIIGEKRQMDGHTNGTELTNGTHGIVAEEILTHLDAKPEASAPDVPVMAADLPDTEAENRVDTPPEAEAPAAGPMDAAAPEPKMPDVSQEVAPQSADEPKPMKLVLGDAVRVAMAETPPENTAPQDATTDAIDAVLTGAAVPEVGSPPASEPAAPPPEPVIQPDMASLMRELSAQDEIEAPSEEAAPAPQATNLAPEPPLQRPVAPTPAVAPAAAEMPTPSPAAMPEPVAASPMDMPQPALGRASARQGRVKTRLLGFNIAQETESDPIADQAEATAAPYTQFPVGWLIVTDGPGRGSAFTLFNGVSKIGRGKDQTVPLDFGDNSISRENHAALAYDPAQKSFFIGHGGKANLVRRNDRPVLSTEELTPGDHITIGETTLRFVALCGQDFSWDAK